MNSAPTIQYAGPNRLQFSSYSTELLQYRAAHLRLGRHTTPQSYSCTRTLGLLVWHLKRVANIFLHLCFLGLKKKQVDSDRKDKPIAIRDPNDSTRYSLADLDSINCAKKKRFLIVLGVPHLRSCRSEAAWAPECLISALDCLAPWPFKMQKDSAQEAKRACLLAPTEGKNTWPVFQYSLCKGVVFVFLNTYFRPQWFCNTLSRKWNTTGNQGILLVLV